MYKIAITFRGNKPVVTAEDQNVDRIWYLAQEWAKQPVTQSIKVWNPTGKVVFNICRCDKKHTC